MNASFLAEKERGSYNGGGDPFPTARIHVDEDAEQDVLEAAVKRRGSYNGGEDCFVLGLQRM